MAYEKGTLLDTQVDLSPSEYHTPGGLVVPDEVIAIAHSQNEHWKRDLQKLRKEGRLMAAHQLWRQPFPGNNQQAPVENQTEVASTEEKLLWDPAGKAPQTAIPANSLVAGEILALEAWGVITTVAEASKTLNLKPRFGTTTAGPELGASGAITVTNAAKTSINWNLQMVVHFRTIGGAGTATCSGFFTSLAIPAPINFGTTGSTSATGSLVTTSASGLIVTATNSVATNKLTCMGVLMESLN